MFLLTSFYKGHGKAGQEKMEEFYLGQQKSWKLFCLIVEAATGGVL